MFETLTNVQNHRISRQLNDRLKMQPNISSKTIQMSFRKIFQEKQKVETYMSGDFCGL